MSLKIRNKDKLLFNEVSKLFSGEKIKFIGNADHELTLPREKC